METSNPTVCPFCGDKPVVYQRQIKCADSDDTKIVYAIGCENKTCKVSPMTFYFDTCEEAIEAWNNRV